MPTPALSLVAGDGRKYLTAAERARFIATARRARPAVQTFALALAHTGCRISEALALRAGDVDLAATAVRFRTLKRRTEVWREVPVPDDLARALELVHGLRRIQDSGRGTTTRLWRFSRATASRHISQLMREAEIAGPQACAKGLRHAFGVAAVEAGVPLPTISGLLGHADIKTTAIYTTALGAEQRELVARMWGRDHTT